MTSGEPGSPRTPQDERRLWASWALATSPDVVEALLKGVPVPRSLLRHKALDILGEPHSGPDWTLTDDAALTLELRTSAQNGAEPHDGDQAEAIAQPLKIQTLEEFAAVDEPSAEPICGSEEDTILSLGGMLVFYGDGGAGKTTMELDFVMHLASGTDWLGLTMQRQSNILVIENEGPRGMFRKKTRRKLEQYEGDVTGRVFVLEDPWALFSFSEEVFRDHLRSAILEHSIDVVAAGPVNRLGIQGGGTPEEVGAFILNIELVRQTLDRPCAVVFAHHENKQGDVSGAWEGVPDTLIHVVNQGNGATKIHWQKVRWGPALHGKTWQLLWKEGESFEVMDKPAERTDEEIEAELIAFVTEHPGCMWKPAREAVKTQIDRLTKLRDRMLEDGRLINGGTPTRMALYVQDSVGLQDDIPL